MVAFLAFAGAAFMGMSIAGGMASSAYQAHQEQQRICKELKKTVRDIEQYREDSIKAIQALKAEYADLHQEVLKHQRKLVEIRQNMKFAQDEYKKEMTKLRAICALCILCVIVLLVLKRLGILDRGIRWLSGDEKRKEN